MIVRGRPPHEKAIGADGNSIDGNPMSSPPSRPLKTLSEIVADEKRIYESGQREIRVGKVRFFSSNLNQGLALIFFGSVAILYGVLSDIEAPVVMGVVAVVLGMLISWYFWGKYKTASREVE